MVYSILAKDGLFTDFIFEIFIIWFEVNGRTGLGSTLVNVVLISGCSTNVLTSCGLFNLILEDLVNDGLTAVDVDGCIPIMDNCLIVSGDAVLCDLEVLGKS